MKQKNNKKTLLLMVLCVVALAVAVLFATGVIGGKKAPAGNEPAAETTDAAISTGIVHNGDVVGEGATESSFAIVDQEGKEEAKTSAGNEPDMETPDAATPTGIVKNGDVVGQGATEFAFVIVDKEGKETAVTVKTDKKTVGEALLDTGIVEGEEGMYGLYVKKVNGILADYDVDQTYWAFYINGEYAMTGVDATEIQPGNTYMMKVEK